MAASIGRLGGSTTDSSHPYSGQIPQFQTAHASSDLDPIYLELQQELSKLIHQESQIDQELIHNYSIIAQGKSILKGYSLSSLGGGISGGSGVSGGAGTGVGTGVYESSADITHHITHLQQYASNSSITDILLQDSKKLFLQIDDCSTLSDRLSALVRRLDLIQLHAQEALACTEDVINIKEYSIIISDAIQQNNIPTAVNYIQYIHQIDEQAVKASDDYQTIQDLTLQLKDLIKSQYEIAIQQNRIDDVLKLCPYLHVVGLETDATEKFLNFIESTIFIGITASISIENHATSPGQPNQAAMYAEILSNIFNTAFTICQQYLPVVIQGLERTYGDIFFIRRLHAKCEKEVDIVVKKYLSYRNVKSMITSLKAPTSNTSKSSSQTPGSSGNIPSSAELHSFLDEIALILQYCSSYSKYLKMLCDGAEHRIRDVSSSSPQAPTVSSASQTVVFKNPTQFEALQQELVNSYYIEGEQWLVKAAVHSFTKSLSQFTTGKVKALSLDIDGYFFVFQRCSQRAIATNNIHAACAILHILSDHLNTDILQQFSDSLNVVVTHAGNKMRDIMSKFLKSSAWYSGSEEQDEAANKSGYIPQGLHNALLFASTLSRELPGAGTNPTESTASPGEGMWGIESHMEILNLLETCIRYSDRLRREITSTGRSVFGDITEQQSTTRQSKQPSSSDEMNKLQLCIEDFESCKESFTQTIRHTISSISGQSQALMKDVISHILSKNGPVGGIRFHLEDEAFDHQPMVQMLPKLLVVPFEVLISISTANLSETNRDMMIGMMVDAYCIRFEQFISQTNFSYAGALKLEECIRALNSHFSQVSTVSLRSRFSRLREIMIVLTSDMTMIAPHAPSSSAISASHPLHHLGLSHITELEAQTFLVLRTDYREHSSD